MPLNLLTKPVSREKTLLSLNIQNVADLFPGFSPADFAVICGSSSMLSFLSLLCVRAQLPFQLGGLSSSVVYVDGGNTFRPAYVSRLAQIHHLDPKQVLNRIQLSKACTAYQMTILVMEHLRDVVEKTNAKMVVVSDIAGLFLDEGIPEEEAKSVYCQILAYLQSFAQEKRIIVIATCPTHLSSGRSSILHSLTCSKANTVLFIRQTPYDGEISLEKHPRFMLGSAEFPSENLSLTDFF